MDQSQIDLIRRIASVVGHELRNPLAVINNSAYYLKTKLGADGRLDPKVEKHLGIVTSEIGRVDRMISDILSFSRPLEVKLAPAALRDCVGPALKGYDFPKSVKVARLFIEGDPKVSLDEKHFLDALRRLFDNAVEAMPQGGELRVALFAVPKGAVVEIRDSGPGVKPEDIGKIFEPFFTTKPKGLGLGLSIARKALEAQGARLEFENAAGGGAVFRMVWPP